mmetsp:Transcript_9996/g.33091  ORF Transcript_9996/g.33091 Transcript_9996/m.33091 type:complete len:255 (-) Transcript_9996:87-851(-)
MALNQSITGLAVPEQALPPHKPEGKSLEARLGQRLRRPAQPVLIPAAVVREHRPGDLHRLAGGPRHGRGGLAQRLRAQVALLCVRRRRVVPAKLARHWRASRHAARVKDWRRSGRSPWRVIVPVLLRAASRAGVDRPEPRIADGRSRRCSAEVELAPPAGVAARRDRPSALPVARGAADGAAVREPEASLAEHARCAPGPIRRRARLPAVRVGRVRLRRSVLVVDRVPRARPRDGAVRRGSRDEGCEERDAEHI